MSSRMTSLSDSMGRVWFDRHPPVEDPQLCSVYMGIRIKCSDLRPNAMTLWDVAPNIDGSSSRTLLRMFSRIVYDMLGSPNVGGAGSRAYLEWDNSNCMERPKHLRIHVLLNPGKPDFDVGAAVRDTIDKLIAADAKAFRSQGSRRPSTGQKWSESDMVLAHDQWAALCGTYAPVGDVAPGEDGLSCCPLQVFSAAHAGVPDRLDEHGGTFTLLRTYVPMRRCDFESRILFRKFLPWYQQAQLGLKVRLDGSNNEQEARMMTRMATAAPCAGVEDHRSVWEKLMDRAPRAREHQPETYAAWALAEISHSMDGEQACYVPSCEAVINMYEMPPFSPTPHADGTLSPFATWVSHFLMQGEAFGWVYKQHLLLLQLLLAGLDCYRECQPGDIKHNIILAGPPSSSKSFAFTLLERLMINGTIETATRRTENALTYSQDQGSRIMIDHELSKDFFGDVQARKTAGGNARTAQTKEVLTSHKATVESCMVDDNGKRVKVRSESRAQLCYFAATNDWSTGGGCDAALISRFFVVFPSLGKVTNKPLNDLMQQDRNPSAADEAGFARMQTWVRNVQKCVYWIMRLIHLKAIPDVDMEAANMAIDRFSRHVTTGTPRSYERVLLLSRMCAIITALHLHYCAPGAPRAGESPRVEHVPEMVPNMVVTAEQAKFCIGLNGSDFFNASEQHVLRAFAKCDLVPDNETGGGNNYLTPNNVNSEKTLLEQLLIHCSSEVTRDSVQQCLTFLREKKIKAMPYTRSPLAQFSVMECMGEQKQTFYAMRGNCIHASLVCNGDDASGGDLGFIETLLSAQCRVGPMGKEITANIVQGFPHLLQIRANDVAPRPYAKECLYLPAASQAILGTNGIELNQAHRQFPRRIVDRPVELDAFDARGGAPPPRPGGGIQYPDDYVAQVSTLRRKFSSVSSLGDVNEEQYARMKRDLPENCFSRHQSAKKQHIAT